MGNVSFIGCLHLGHEWMAKHRGFNSVEEYHETLIKTWNTHVNKKDLVYILGDITMENPQFYPILDQLKGRKKVVMGNHDMGKDVPELLKYVETVSGMIHYKGFWLTHAPIHPQELAFVLGNIHAHVHEQGITKTVVETEYWDKPGIVTSMSGQGYYNVDAQAVNYRPLTLEQLVPNLGNQQHFENLSSNIKMRGN